jgi:hypothetical protein
LRNTRITCHVDHDRSAILCPRPSNRSQIMNWTQAILATLATFAGVSAVTQALAQESSATPAVAHGKVDGHAWQSDGSAELAATGAQGQPGALDLQLALSAGRHHADANGVSLKITDSASQTVFALDRAAAWTDVDLPAGNYHVLADFGRIKRMGSVDVEKGELATLYRHAPGETGGSGS